MDFNARGFQTSSGCILVKGYSAREDMCELTGVFCRLALEARVCTCIDRVTRVSTDANPADPPSRDKMDAGVASLGWKTVPAEFPELRNNGVGQKVLDS